MRLICGVYRFGNREEDANPIGNRARWGCFGLETEGKMRTRLGIALDGVYRFGNRWEDANPIGESRSMECIGLETDGKVRTRLGIAPDGYFAGIKI